MQRKPRKDRIHRGTSRHAEMLRRSNNDGGKKTAREGNVEQLHDTTNKLERKYGKPEQLVKRKQGDSITGIHEQRKRCVEHYEEHLNKPTQLNIPDIDAARTNLPMNVASPTIKKLA
ncbi:unnamed protein product [Schistosoma curassoni]|uniref:Uncharacterized protein n=1 Tax=Schistosoma curassoni TaxID=6186 RepID=A0A183KBM1_9TREM|nr:unnamed protein product [Schistosoma curassoni]